MIACLQSLGCNLNEMTIVDGMDVMIAASKCFPPRICSIRDFYPSLFPKKEKLQLCEEPPELEAGLSINNGRASGIRSADQFTMLARAGYANIKKKEKK